MAERGLNPDLQMAEQFLTLLDEELDQHMFQLYHDYDKKKSAMVLKGSLQELETILSKKNQQGYSICVTVNITDGKGRKKENIVGARAIWRENDTPGSPCLPDQPHIINETSPDHFHEFFLVDGADLAEWESVQQRLVDDYGSDKGAKDLPRVLRVPGFFHQKDPNNPFMVRTVSTTGAMPTPWEEIKKIFPPVIRKQIDATAPNSGTDWNGINPEEVISAINSLNPDMEYQEWLSVGMALHDGFNGSDLGLQIWRQWSLTGQKYQDGDCDTRWQGFKSDYTTLVRIETLFKLANDTGWRWEGDKNVGSDTDDDKEEPENKSIASLVIKHVTANAQLYHDADNTGYAAITVDSRRELWPIESAYFKQWLGQTMYKNHSLILNKNIWSDVQNVLLGMAIFDGDDICVHVRTACIEGAYYLDLCRNDWSIVKIEPGQWSISSAVKNVFFRRTSAMRPLPVPKNYDYTYLPSLLREHLNTDDANIHLLIAYLIECLMPDTEYPILELTGSPGSGKSTVQEMIREIIDPNKVNLRAAPKTVEDVFVSAGNNHLVSYNNLSKISAGMSDALCSLSTGGGHAGRKFYTNTDEIAVDIQKPVCMNGVSCIAKQSDLIDRLIRITLQPIDSLNNRAKKQIMESFNDDLPKILGSLLNCICKVLEVLPDVELERLPRMADFAKLCQALTQVYQWEPGLLETYYSNRAVSFEETLETSPAIMGVVKLVQRDSIFEGTIKSLFEAIQSSSTDNWVKTYRGLAEKLRMYTPALKAISIQVWFDPVRKNDGYHVMIKGVGKQYSPRSPCTSDKRTATAKSIRDGEYSERSEPHSDTTSRTGEIKTYEVTV